MGAAMPKLQRTSLEDQVYQTLRNAIIAGELQGTTRLVQEDLAAQLGTSRIPVRDALRRLETAGLVTAGERGTYRVTPFGVVEAREVYAVRVLLEPPAAAAAVCHLTTALLDQLVATHAALQDASTGDDLDRYLQLNYTFHMTLYAAGGNTRLTGLIAQLWSGMPPLTPLGVPGQLARSVAEHADLLAALQAGAAAQVEQLMRDHIQHAGAALIAQLGPPLGERS